MSSWREQCDARGRPLTKASWCSRFTRSTTDCAAASKLFCWASSAATMATISCNGSQLFRVRSGTGVRKWNALICKQARPLDIGGLTSWYCPNCVLLVFPKICSSASCAGYGIRTILARSTFFTVHTVLYAQLTLCLNSNVHANPY